MMIHLDTLPAALLPYFKTATITNSSSNSTASVWKLSTGYYLKMDSPKALEEEYNLCHWFFKEGLGVEPIYYTSTDYDYLLTREGKGNPAHQYLEQPKKLCQVLAQLLHKIHNHPKDNLPAPNRLKTYLKFAQTQAEQGAFDPQVLLPRFEIQTRQEALALMTEKRQLLQADSFIHGDYCLPNILLTPDFTTATFIDVGLAGKSDRHIDLFWAIWSLHYNLGHDRYGDYFLDCYGRELIDLEKLQLIAAIESFG